MSNKATFQPAFNSDIDTWNVPVNANTQNFDDALGTVQTFALTSVSGTVAVSGTSFAGAYPANTASYIPLIFICSGIPTGAVTLQIPAGIGGIWIVNNQCTGVFSPIIVASGGAGTLVSVPGGSSTTVYSDGTNINSTSTLFNASTAINDNRIINGDMRIDQRNNGASAPANGAGAGYWIDRWEVSATVAAKFSFGRNLNSVVSAPGFPYYFGCKSTSAYTPGAADEFCFLQSIEADAVSDFAWGTSGAQPVTLSFWVYSSLTGTFGGSVRNYAATRSYPFTYSISVANTWAKIVITIPGDTSGTWVMSGSGGALSVIFSLGAGSTFSGSAGAWATGNYITATGAVSVISSSLAVLYVTGVKLEIGGIATAFPEDSLAKRLADCQRYYQTNGVTPGTPSGAGTCGYFFSVGVLNSGAGGVWIDTVTFPPMRAIPPAVSVYDGAGTPGRVSFYSAGWKNGGAPASIAAFSSNSFFIQVSPGNTYINFNYAVSAEL